MTDTRTLEGRKPAERPLSPHLQIYRPTLTMMMSIVHRITGAALYFGTLLVAWWLIAASSPNAYARFQWFASSWIGRLILFGYTTTCSAGSVISFGIPAAASARTSGNGSRRRT
jgi:hypothetical protein